MIGSRATECQCRITPEMIEAAGTYIGDSVEVGKGVGMQMAEMIAELWTPALRAMCVRTCKQNPKSSQFV